MPQRTVHSVFITALCEPRKRRERTTVLWGISLGALLITASSNLSAWKGQNTRMVRQTEALHLAVQSSHVPGVYEALKTGANPNGLQADHAIPPVCRAVWQDDHQTLKLLLSHGATPNVSCGDLNSDGTKDTPLYLAALSHNPAMVESLLTYGAVPNDDVDRPGERESRALRAAAWRGHLEAVNALLVAGANPHTSHVTGTGTRTKTRPLVSALRAAGWKECADRIAQAQQDAQQ